MWVLSYFIYVVLISKKISLEKIKKHLHLKPGATLVTLYLILPMHTEDLIQENETFCINLPILKIMSHFFKPTTGCGFFIVL